MGSLRVEHDSATSLSLFTSHFYALEKEMATHSSILAWRIPGTEEPSGLPSMGSHRVGHDWSDLAAAAKTIIHEGKHINMLNLLKLKMTLGKTLLELLWKAVLPLFTKHIIFLIYNPVIVLLDLLPNELKFCHQQSLCTNIYRSFTHSYKKCWK